MDELKGDKWLDIPSTDDGFRGAVSALRFLSRKEVVSFHHFTLPEDRCLRLIVKNLGRVAPESVVRVGLESLNIRVQGVTQLLSGSATRTPPRTAVPPHTPSYR